MISRKLKHENSQAVKLKNNSENVQSYQMPTCMGGPGCKETSLSSLPHLPACPPITSKTRFETAVQAEKNLHIMED